MNRAVPAEGSELWGCLSGSQVILTPERERADLERGNYLRADPKVTQLHLASRVHQHIGGLHICRGNKTILSMLSWIRIVYTEVVTNIGTVDF